MKQRSEKHPDITSLPIIPGTVVICVSIAVFFLILLFTLWGAQLLPRPAFIEALFFRAPSASEGDSFSEEFLSSLVGTDVDLSVTDTSLSTMSPEELSELLLSLVPAQNYYQNAIVTITRDGYSITHQIHCLVSGERMHAEIRTTGRDTRTVTADGERIFIRDGEETRLFLRENTDFTPESEVGIPSLARMQSLLRAAKDGAYTVSYQTVLSSPCIRVSFTDTVSSVTETLDVMPDYGVIIAAYSFLPGESAPYYHLLTTSVKADTRDYDPSIFDIPNP